MKKFILTSAIAIICITVQAQIKPVPRQVAPSRQIKGASVKPTTKLTGCDYIYAEYKEFVYHALRKPDDETLHYNKVMPNASVRYHNGKTYLHFSAKKGTHQVPPFLPRVAVPHVHPTMMSEGWGIYENINNDYYIFSFDFDEGDYQNIVEVTEIYRRGNNRYAEVKRPNGTLEQVLIAPGFIIEGDCQIPVRGGGVQPIQSSRR